MGTVTKELDDLVELTDAPDMISWDDDPNSKRAKMPCGHAIGPESLTAYCESLLSSNKFQFHCPHIDPDTNTYCGKEWEYIIVRRLAVLTAEEKKKFETKIAENYMKKAIGIQECPECHSLCERADPKDRRVVCPICTKKKGQMFEYCWYCLKEWKQQFSIKKCGNEECTGKDHRLEILEKAVKKKIVGVSGCPGIRACPKCGMLIEHTKACMHMACMCGQRFCFICLKIPVNGAYQCGTFNSPCAVASVQTKIPGD